ncbi:MAG: hypothetical protein Q8K85_21405, partial [Hyphomicrobium sp.]|nr:hypothetical protein [Hyphomicrobium sp.]
RDGLTANGVFSLTPRLSFTGVLLQVTGCGYGYCRDVRDLRLPYIIGSGGSNGKTGGLQQLGETWPI